VARRFPLGSGLLGQGFLAVAVVAGLLGACEPGAGVASGTGGTGVGGTGVGGAPAGSGGTTGDGSGGALSSGGAVASGGAVGSGGFATGGAPGSGGVGTGGSPGSGGTSVVGSGGAAASGGAGSGGGDAWLSMSETARILPLGDSITAEGSCWRHDLWLKLEDGGITNVDFVGSLTAGDCGGGYDSDHEGHGGVLVTNVTPSEMNSWFSAADADVVLMHFGTNDVWNNVPTQDILDAYTGIVAALRAVNAEVIVLVAQIIPMAEDQCAPCQTSIPALNAALPAWAAEQAQDSSPIFVVDQFTGFDTEADTTDGVHPYTASGADKMASRWFDAIVALY